MAVQGIALVRPRAVIVYEGASLLLVVGLLAMAGRALAGGPLVAVTQADSPAAPLATLLNVAGWFGLVVVAFMAIASIVVTVVRWIVQERRRDGAMTTA
jgi:cytochrome c oxidase assembly factor CtaG